MSLVKKFASVGGATMASRLLGFVREALIGAALWLGREPQPDGAQQGR